MPNKLATPKVTAISEEQNEAFNKSDLTDGEPSTQDPPVDAYSVEDFDEDYYLDYGLEDSNLENY